MQSNIDPIGIALPKKSTTTFTATTTNTTQLIPYNCLTHLKKNGNKKIPAK